MGRIEAAGAVAVVLALTLSSVAPVEAARTGTSLDYEPQDDRWSACLYAGPCDDSPTYRLSKHRKVPKPPKALVLTPPPRPEDFLPPKTPPTWHKVHYEGPGSKPRNLIFSWLTPGFGPEGPAEDAASLSKKRPGVYRSKNGTTIRVRVNRIAAPEAFRKMKAYNKGARQWNKGRQRGFTGGFKPDPRWGGGVGWKKVKATPYRSRTVGFIPNASLGQALSALASSFASAVNGEATVVKIGGIKKPEAARDRKASRNGRKAKKVGG